MWLTGKRDTESFLCYTFTFTIQDVAAVVRYKLGLNAETTESIVEEHIAQIEKSDDRIIDREGIPEDDYDFLLVNVSAAQRSGDLGTRELENLRVTMLAIRAAELDRDPQVRAAL